jgi:cysteine desulfurase
MLANNEVGTVYPIREWVQACQAEHSQVHFHCDGVQGVGELSNLAQRMFGVDSFSLSGHKIGGLKGVGALYLKAARTIEPHFQGGGQECGLRPGTHNMPGIISLGQRFLALPQIEESYREMRALRDLLAEKLRSLPGLVIHGDLDNGLPNTINFHLNKSKVRLVDCLEQAGISVSSGSACSSSKSAGSRVLMTMGYSEDIAANSARVSLGSATRLEDVERMVRCMTQLVAERLAEKGEQELGI